MRQFYVLVTVIFIACVLIFISSFVYLDMSKHQTYYYIINLGGHDIGTVKIEKFVTEDKLIYRSVTNLPFSPLFTEIRSRLTLDRRYNIENYLKQWSAGGQTAFAYLETDGKLASFVSRFDSEFVFLDNIPLRKETSIFEEESPETYLPVIENYNFRLGRSQGFNALTFFSCALPPMHRFVTLTSIRNEYLKIGAISGIDSRKGTARKIKAENLLLKIRNYPQGSIWVAKSDKSLLKIEMPKKSLSISRVFRPIKLEAAPYVPPPDDAYTNETITFKNNNVELAGTVSAPKKEGRHPAVLLVWGSGPQDRQYQGLFNVMADYLARNGFMVLRFDKRGIASSGGSFPTCTDNDLSQDVAAALEYLKNRKDTDQGRIFLISHSEGAFYALKAAAEKNIVCGLILMSPTIPSWLTGSGNSEEQLARAASGYGWSDDYLKLTLRSLRETENKIKNSKQNWTSILRKRCFLKTMRERLGYNPYDIVKKTTLPVLILQGQDDKTASLEFASICNKLLEEGGNKKHSIRYYPGLGHFLGNAVNDGVHRMFYDTDKQVLKDMKEWLDARALELAAGEQKALTPQS